MRNQKNYAFGSLQLLINNAGIITYASSQNINYGKKLKIEF